MICLHCGYCCFSLSVVIVDDPEKGIVEDNLIFKSSDEKCKPLVGDKPGQFKCGVHGYSWYKDTPCFSHGQIERSKTDPCRMGEAFTNGRLDPAIFAAKRKPLEE